MAYQQINPRSSMSPEKIWRKNLLQGSIDNVFEKLNKLFPIVKVSTCLKLIDRAPVSVSVLQLSGPLAFFTLGRKLAGFFKLEALERKHQKAVKCWMDCDEYVIADGYIGEMASMRRIKDTDIVQALIGIQSSSKCLAKYGQLMINSSRNLHTLNGIERMALEGLLHTSPKTLGLLSIPLPPLEVQQQIVDLLEPIEAAANMTWLSTRGFTRVEDLHKDVLQVAIDNVFERLSGVLKPLNSIAEIRFGIMSGGYTKYQWTETELNVLYSDEVPVFSISDAPDFLSTKKLASKKAKNRSAKKGSVCVFFVPHGGELPVERLKYDGVPYGLSVHSGLLLDEFMRFMLKSSQTLQYITTRGSAMGGDVDWNRFQKLPIPIPPLEIQQQIVEYLSLIENSSKTLKSNATQSSQLIFTET